MQELRLVLIVVGALAIAALLFHGLWTSKKEKSSKFSAESLKDDDMTENSLTANDDFVVIKKTSKDSAFGVERSFEHDPLDPLSASIESDVIEPLSTKKTHFEDDAPLPSVTLGDVDDAIKEDDIIFSDGDVEFISKPRKVSLTPTPKVTLTADNGEEGVTGSESDVQVEDEVEAEPEMQVIVLHVHCSGEAPFVGSKLFDSMQQNGLIYGEMDIYHRHADLSGNGKVLFSVANMMQPGTLQHDDPATFTTKGISFFMTLPCFGEADQNFKLMLKTAQQIADDLGANVLDDQRNLLTPDRLATYRSQVRDFDANKNAHNS